MAITTKQRPGRSFLDIETKRRNPHEPSVHAGFPMVGVTGLEPMASWSRTKRDTKLRHTPMALFRVLWYYNIFRAQNQGLFSKNLKIRKTAVHVPIFSSPVRGGTGACVCRAFRRCDSHCRIYLSAGTDQVQIFRLRLQAGERLEVIF